MLSTIAIQPTSRIEATLRADGSIGLRVLGDMPLRMRAELTATCYAAGADYSSDSRRWTATDAIGLDLIRTLRGMGFSVSF